MLTILQPDTERIMSIEHRPTHDRAPEDLALGSPLWLRDDLMELIGEEQVHARLINLIKCATDAIFSVFKAHRKSVGAENTVV